MELKNAMVIVVANKAVSALDIHIKSILCDCKGPTDGRYLSDIAKECFNDYCKTQKEELNLVDFRWYGDLEFNI